MPAPLVIRRRMVVSGRVQGVFFRDTCRRRALGLGVAGWVANRQDGRVEAAFEGSPEAVEDMVAWCRRGPPLANVTGVEISHEHPLGEAGFAVR